MCRTITMIGHFGGNQNFTDGQTVKTLNLYSELKKTTGWEIIKVDTYYNHRNTVKLLWDTFRGITKSKDIVILLSGNGMKVYFPLLYCAAKIFHKKIYHDVIGGNLSYYIRKYPRYKKYLNSFKVNWVETKLLKQELEKCGIVNVDILPNFRRFNAVDRESLTNNYSEPYKFCTFSRVIKEKGIEDAIKAIEKVNTDAGKLLSHLDIYGPIDASYKDHFQNILNKSSTAISYKGEVSSEEAIDTLKNYYSILFPTYWDGEGCPGTILEGFIAGVPVIATDWHCNKEMIKNGYNGLVYPSEEAKTLEEAILWIIAKSNNIIDLKRNCLKSAYYYRPDAHIKKVIQTIENG